MKFSEVKTESCFYLRAESVITDSDLSSDGFGRGRGGVGEKQGQLFFTLQQSQVYLTMT